MFKGLVFILLLGFVILLVIVAIVVSFVYRTVHRVKKVLNGENPDDDYNPEIGKKHRHYTHKAYNGSGRQAYSQGQYAQGSQNQYAQGSTRDTENGDILYETRNPDQANRQIFTADEGEYVEFSEEN